MMKYDWESLDLNGCSVPEVILALQTWEAENPTAVDTSLSLYTDGDSAYAEVTFHRPMTEEEIALKAREEASILEYAAQRDRAEYIRLKILFEGS